jgi:flagellar biosynthesis activator protein FlaF
MSNAANAYARTAQQSSSPRDIEAQTLLMAARKLVEVQQDCNKADKRFQAALLFNRRLWTIFMTAAESNDNPQPPEIRQNIRNIAMFVLQRTVELQSNPTPEKIQSLININSNIAAGLAGRP